MRLLLVEDNTDLAGPLIAALTENGFAVEHATDGGEGLDRALEQDFDVVLLDLMLPGLDGRSVLRHLRRERGVPVLILTARDSLEDRVGGLEDGADDYLTKPFELPELIARLRALVRRNAGSATDRVAVGDLVLDLRRRRVTVRRRAIDLTVQEYRLLEALALKGGEPLSRLELWQHLSGVEDPYRSNAVKVHIHNLRSKLGAERIRTRRGFGYSLVEPKA